MKRAFTMIELIFVIVVLGILAGVALPRLMAPAEDARDVKLKSDISSIRSAISLLRGKNMLQGKDLATNGFPSALDDATTASGQELFDGNTTVGTLLTYPIRSSDEEGGWKKVTTTTYNARRGNGATVLFTYTTTNGKFDCDHTNADCQAISE